MPRRCSTPLTKTVIGSSAPAGRSTRSPTAMLPLGTLKSTTESPIWGVSDFTASNPSRPLNRSHFAAPGVGEVGSVRVQALEGEADGLEGAGVIDFEGAAQ